MGCGVWWQVRELRAHAHHQGIPHRGTEDCQACAQRSVQEEVIDSSDFMPDTSRVWRGGEGVLKRPAELVVVIHNKPLFAHHASIVDMLYT